ncbi:MAG: iron-sulfur cluster assembly scaffold protein [Eggerthellaceae bacterium]
MIDPDTRTFVRRLQNARLPGRPGCASVVCSMLEGCTFDEALAITTDDVKTALDGVPVDKVYTLHFAIEAVRALIGDYLVRQGASSKS